jgi:hypothetical protein
MAKPPTKVKSVALMLAQNKLATNTKTWQEGFTEWVVNQKGMRAISECHGIPCLYIIHPDKEQQLFIIRAIWNLAEDHGYDIGDTCWFTDIGEESWHMLFTYHPETDKIDIRINGLAT